MTTRPRLALLLALLGLAALLAPAGAAGAKPPPRVRTAKVEIGAPSLAPLRGHHRTILVPVTYPIQYAGRVVETRVRLLSRDGLIASWKLHERLDSGLNTGAEQRLRFRFVHRIDLSPKLGRRLGGHLRLRVAAGGPLDVDGDGKPELSSRDAATQPLPDGRAGRGLCSTTPRLRVKPGRRISVPLPVCATGAEWAVFKRPDQGSARIRHGRLVYRAPRRFRGTAEIGLGGKRLGAARLGAGASELEPLVPAYVHVTVGTAGGVVVRALGDSVTAGFGYFSNGKPMTIGQLFGCRPAEKEFNDACSSNSLVTSGTKGKVEYAPDYGLANDVSWAAQWSNEHGITNYANFAISGSEPANWAPEGEFHSTTERIESEKPDYILMTMGANPLLSDMLFGVDNMGCAVESDIVGGYRECIEAAFAEVHLQEDLKKLYADLVLHTGATIYLMQYHLSVPSTALAYTATQIAEMGKLLNREIATVAAEVNPVRLRVVSPPHFNVGIDIRPVYPSRFSCSRLGYEVDGPSVQSTATQDELEALHFLSFCEGPAGGGPPWVISGDTGIHPSTAGYAQMASQVPPPAE